MDVEPWLRGTLTEFDPLRRQVLHALELTREDAARWCSDLTLEEMNARPYGVAPVSYHLRHIARSLDRLLSYAEGAQLGPEQRAALERELDRVDDRQALLDEFAAGLEAAKKRIGAVDPSTYAEARGVGREQLPVTVGGLLIHCAEHTQRHTGQAITTAKIVRGMRSADASK